MKRIVFLLLILLTLTGCGKQAQETQVPTQESLAAPTEPAGSYDPDSQVEQFTGGAVRVYPQNIPDIYAIACAGEDVLVFSGMGNTTITRLTGENLYRIAQRDLDCNIYPNTTSSRIWEDGMVYYDYGKRQMVFLDENLREYDRAALPGDILGDPAITADRTALYYFTETGLYAKDLESGISRIVREMRNDYQVVDGLLMEDTLVRCSTVDAFENWHVLYIDARTGELLEDTDGSLSVLSGNGMYYGISYEETGETVVFGQPGQQARTFLATAASLQVFPEAGTVLLQRDSEEGWKLDYYDLITGLRTHSVTLPNTAVGWCFARDAENNRLYYYGLGDAESTILYRWDLDESPAFDEAVYTDVWYTEEKPDEEGLEACQTRAEAMSQRFGLDIRIWDRAVEIQPWDYDLEPEHRVYVIEETLDQVEASLSAFPEGFVGQILESLEGGILRLCLVGSLTGSAETGSLDTADGIQFWIGEDSYLAIVPGEKFSQTLFHELFHAMEMRILSKSIAYYRWDELNPPGFTYDYDYVVNQYRDGSAYIEDDTTRAFIDTCSMSFPKEDRARIFEYACMEGKESYFLSETMQKKLRTLCEGIRDAYGLAKSEESFLWEQYLDSPLAYTK